MIRKKLPARKASRRSHKDSRRRSLRFERVEDRRLLAVDCIGGSGSVAAIWPIENGGNGHCYRAVASSVTWEQADELATAAGGYLATITSAAENDFIFSLIDSEQFWVQNQRFDLGSGPWIGGFQPSGSTEPGGNWQWVTGEQFAFSNWLPGQPSNDGGGINAADRIHFFTKPSGRASTWNDVRSSVNEPGFVIEFESEPADLVANSISWDSSRGGVSFATDVFSDALEDDVDVVLYWAGGDQSSDKSVEAYRHTIPAGTGASTNIGYASPSDLAAPHLDTTHLIMVADAEDSVTEADESNNERAIAIPLRINDFEATELFISAVGKMPELPSATVEIVGVPLSGVTNASVNWTAVIEYDASGSPNGPPRSFYDFATATLDVSDAYQPEFEVVRGGNLVLSASAEIVGIDFNVSKQAATIGGTNPTIADIQARVTTEAAERGLDEYVDEIGQILRQESGYRQFVGTASGGTGNDPLWSGDNLGGVGLGQITVPEPTADQIWDWRENVDAAMAKFHESYRSARNYRNSIRGPVFNSTLRSSLASLNQQRAEEGLRPIRTATIPRYTETQLTRDAIRGYNGFAGRFLNGPLHEYRLETGEDGNLIISAIGRGPRGELGWELVPTADRPQDVGDPEYVDNVLAQEAWQI